MKYFLITYDLMRPGQEYERLIAELKTFPACRKIMQSTFIVGINGLFNSSDVMRHLSTFLDSNDRIFVSDISKPCSIAATLPIADLEWIRAHEG